MTLLDDRMEECHLKVHTTVDDDEGGISETWSDGDVFMAAIVFNQPSSISTALATIAGAEHVSENCLVLVEDGYTLHIGDVFSRDADGGTYRVLTNSSESMHPGMSSIRVSPVSAERWNLT